MGAIDFTRDHTLLSFSMLYFSLFFMHIIFAASGLTLMFQVVAILITILTLSTGVLFCIVSNTAEKIPIYRQGFLISIILSSGLGWAYGDMEMSHLVLSFPILSSFIHIIGLKVVFKF